MYHRSLNGNFAYIDNQNMYMSTHKGEHPWDIDMRKLRVYLEEKYNVIQAYLFMGAFDLQRQNLYMMLQQCGYILVLREHGIGLKGIAVLEPDSSNPDHRRRMIDSSDPESPEVRILGKVVYAVTRF